MSEPLITPPPAQAPGTDPRPQPPRQPGLEDCCLSGCNPCVFELYEQALERYELALAGWKARHQGEVLDP
jgi:hypothetical protein